MAVIGAAGCTEFRKNRHLKRGDAYYAEKKYKEAMLEYRNVLRFEKENPHAIARLGLAHFTQGELGQAYAFLNKAASSRPTTPRSACAWARSSFWPASRSRRGRTPSSS